MQNTMHTEMDMIPDYHLEAGLTQADWTTVLTQGAHMLHATSHIFCAIHTHFLNNISLTFIKDTMA
jgi:hypothetical protein